MQTEVQQGIRTAGAGSPEQGGGSLQQTERDSNGGTSDRGSAGMVKNSILMLLLLISNGTNHM